jgi:hypothetical protein
MPRQTISKETAPPISPEHLAPLRRLRDAYEKWGQLEFRVMCKYTVPEAEIKDAAAEVETALEACVAAGIPKPAMQETATIGYIGA